MVAGRLQDDMAVVLLVDDDRADLMLLSQAMQAAAPDVELVAARTAKEVRQALDEHSIDLVLLDLNMPGASGFEILEAIRGDGQHARLPVLILTTSAADADVLRAYELGANAFITKPADLKGTIDIMRRIATFWFDVAVLPGARR